MSGFVARQWPIHSVQTGFSPVADAVLVKAQPAPLRTLPEGPARDLAVALQKANEIARDARNAARRAHRSDALEAVEFSARVAVGAVSLETALLGARGRDRTRIATDALRSMGRIHAAECVRLCERFRPLVARAYIEIFGET